MPADISNCATAARWGAQFLMSEGVTARRACKIAGPSTAAPYRKSAPDKDSDLRERLCQARRPSMGYRMVDALVRSEFAPLNIRRVHRIWREEKLGRMRRYRKKRTGESAPIKADAPNQVWCIDFLFDTCMNATRLEILGVKDEYTKECLALEIRSRFRLRTLSASLKSASRSTERHGSFGPITAASFWPARSSCSCRLAIRSPISSSQGRHGRTALSRASILGCVLSAWT
ncbi:MAG: IS3 family transposase [Armatimonadetes bacterium]|nr:IS3 family transposase [Armatimonadota bacterium]